ncbi:sigma-70 family RNA polymerase sigma factor [Clostridium gasigenes]|uniref:Sigma-70 family RNA polymerase sigma factor n=1 Tax=Clostridium gasigenes TaxID=94869 RepID=A0A7X0VSM9_9CLOT|nr:sigma-70 family RNA polymerase sigma factor [Clostridium gasigenes]MBB6715860.1 sigma-70 family RNA polymerase sigma factor [Clostridium gasigenes]
MNEQELIQGLKDGKEKYLYILIDHYGKLFYGIIKSILCSSHEESFIDQCYNDVILTIWFNIKKYDENKGPFKNWLISLIRFKSIDFKRSCNKMYRNEVLSPNLEDSCNILSEIIKTEEKAELIKAIESLDEIDREVFKLRFLEESTIDDISSKLKISKSTVYTRISRGKIKLKNIIEGVTS